jgi:protein transport protein SEC61 subunit alpha
VQGFRCECLPDEMNLIATQPMLAVFVIIYLQGFRIEIPVKRNRFRGQHGSYPVKPLRPSRSSQPSLASIHMSTSSAKCFSPISPIISSETTDFGRYVMWSFSAAPFRSNMLPQPMGESAQLAATSGFAHYISPLRTLRLALVDPIHTVLYILFIHRYAPSSPKPRLKCRALAPVILRSN